MRLFLSNQKDTGDRMSSHRVSRAVIALLAFGALLAASCSHDAWAGYPERIIRIVVPFAPGGGSDVIARTLAQEMAKDLGATVIIENKPGAGTIIGTQAVAGSEPDGYTSLMGTFANAVNPSLNSKLPYDPHKSFAPVALIARSFNIVVVNPASPIKSIADLIAAAKAEPDKLSYGTFGTGTSAERLPAFPQLPTVAESGIPGYAAESWYGLFAPAGTPADIVDRLNKSAAIAVRSEAFRRLGVNEGLVMAAGPPEELEQRRGSALAQGDPGRGDQD
jgi:tripartite-type tricarboxylate transporter receptor subunit TctC